MGSFITSNGRFEGEFKNGMRTGIGKQTNNNGSSYEGEFLDGDFNGQGTYRWANGRQYKGQFVKNRSHGFGVQTFSNGTYKGYFKDDKPNGVGVRIYSPNNKYEGQWKNGLFHGIGTLYLGLKGRVEFESCKDQVTGYGIQYQVNKQIRSMQYKKYLHGLSIIETHDKEYIYCMHENNDVIK